MEETAAYEQEPVSLGGKHRILAELARVEQEVLFLEVITSFPPLLRCLRAINKSYDVNYNFLFLDQLRIKPIYVLQLGRDCLSESPFSSESKLPVVEFPLMERESHYK